MPVMRAMIVLTALLSLAVPGVSARVIELQSPISVTQSMKAPAAPLPEIHRPAAKADQSHGFGILPRTYRLAPAFKSIELVAIASQEPPSLDRHGPPLAPRPPPSR